jgi:hypothetical protein
MPERLYLCDPLLERLSPDFEDMACARGPRIQRPEAMMGQRHIPRHRQLAAADHADRGDGVMRGAEGARGRDSGAPPG